MGRILPDSSLAGSPSVLSVEVKTLVFFVVLIAIAGFLVYRYFDGEECPRSPVTKQCLGTTTGYEQTPSGGSGAGGGGAPIQMPAP
jgi:hypothetical protein